MRINKKIMLLLIAATATALVALANPAALLAQAEAYVPTVHYEGVPVSSQATAVPPTVTLHAVASDPDSPTGLPSMMRFLFRTAVAGDGQVINTEALYNEYLDEMIAFADSSWSEWVPYPDDPADAVITFADLEDQQYYLVAVQVMDEDGAVSMGREYGQSVINIQVRANFFRPSVTVQEYYLGTATSDHYNDIASGQPLNFQWSASADAYGGTIVSYRHGWDLVDPDDPNDPGWAVPPGTAPENRFAEERIFNEGHHVFTLRVEDNSGQVTVLDWHLNVIPFVSPAYQYPLMLIDQVIDDNSNAWPGEGGTPSYDNQIYRNTYWHFLDGPQGVVGFSWDRDRYNQTDQVSLQDVVHYRSVLINARANGGQLLFNQFRSVDGADKFVWLTPYQKMSGNIFLVGDRSMESFLEIEPNYMVPLIFNTWDDVITVNGQSYIIGFGGTTLPNGVVVKRGPRQYPYDAAGISLIDWNVPVNKYIYGRPYPASSDRKSRCAGLKSLVLDADFEARHLQGSGAIMDTIGTNSLIDWADDRPYDLEHTFIFQGDEFVDANISSRPTSWGPQYCDGGPDNMCLEPMFRGQARFDWVREGKWAEGDLDWPYSEYNSSELDDLCGEMALTAYQDIPEGTARTNGLTYGYLSYKSVADKPSGKADVYWGFDPYRFDSEATRDAIRWVLDYFGLNLNR